MFEHLFAAQGEAAPSATLAAGLSRFEDPRALALETPETEEEEELTPLTPALAEELASFGLVWCEDSEEWENTDEEEISFEWCEDSAIDSLAESYSEDHHMWQEMISEMAWEYAKEAEEDTLLEHSGYEKEEIDPSEMSLELRKFFEDRLGKVPTEFYQEA